jgi:hypothetical protein
VGVWGVDQRAKGGGALQVDVADFRSIDIVVNGVPGVRILSPTHPLQCRVDC